VQTGTGLTTKDIKFKYNTTGDNDKIERYLDGLLILTTTNTYDSHGRLKGITQRNSTGIIAQSTYVLDNLNRLTSTTKNGQTQTYDYDSTDQIKTVTGSNSEAYTYDQNGNRTNSGYITDAGNRLRSDGTYSYEYDFEGNRTTRTKIADGTVDTYSWDYRNRLMGIVTTDLDGLVTRTVGYTYDVDDQRVSKTVDGVVENYYLDGNQIAFVTDGGGNETFHYLYGLNVDQVLAQDSSTGMVWALADRLGSVDTLTDADGHVVDERTFDSFGRVLSQSNPAVSFRYGYTGRELDLESGLDYYRARYYDSAVGRFISVDPMGFGAGNTNLYRYVGNNSTNNTDPSGMWINFAIGAAIGGVLDLGLQLWEQKGDFSKIDPTRLAISTVAGALGGGIGGALGKGGFLLKGTALADQGLGLGARTAINAGVGFNVGYWGKVAENGIKGQDLTEGALFTGIAGGAGAAIGELAQAGIGKLLNPNAAKAISNPLNDALAPLRTNYPHIDWNIHGNGMGVEDAAQLATNISNNKIAHELFGNISDTLGRNKYKLKVNLMTNDKISNIGGGFSNSLQQNTWGSKLAAKVQQYIPYKFNLAKNTSLDLNVNSINNIYKEESRTTAENLLYVLTHEGTHAKQQLGNKFKPTYPFSNEVDAFTQQELARMSYNGMKNPQISEELEESIFKNYVYDNYRDKAHYINDLPDLVAKYDKLAGR
jgi:RHS repeat-associated protein